MAVEAKRPLLIALRPELRYEITYREAEKLLLSTLVSLLPTDYKFALHAFAGDPALVLKLLRVFPGCHVVFNGICAFSKSNFLRELAFEVLLFCVVPLNKC